MRARPRTAVSRTRPWHQSICRCADSTCMMAAELLMLWADHAAAGVSHLHDGLSSLQRCLLFERQAEALALQLQLNDVCLVDHPASRQAGAKWDSGDSPVQACCCCCCRSVAPAPRQQQAPRPPPRPLLLVVCCWCAGVLLPLQAGPGCNWAVPGDCGPGTADSSCCWAPAGEFQGLLL